MHSMMPFRVFLVVVSLVAFFGARNTTAVSPASESSTIERRAEPNQSRVDLDGNDVNRAVGDYRIDARGDMYQRHAPDTALLRLGPPST